MLRVEVVDQLSGHLKFISLGMEPSAFKEGDGFRFGADISFADIRPRADGRTYAAGLGGLRGVVHRQQDEGKP